jgi:sec-independent protein translocase protein TatC
LNIEKNKKTNMEHFKELRLRVILSLSIVIICFFVLFAYSKPITDFLTKPLFNLGYKLYFSKVNESFMTTLKSSFIASIFITSPIWIFIIIGFIIPALNKKQKYKMLFFVSLSYIFFVLGFYFSYKVLIPITLKFFISYANTNISSMITINFYLEYFLSLFIGTGIGFQLPIVMLIISKLGLINYQVFSKSRKYSIIIILIIAAILTPPDIVSQITLSIPLYLLYEFGVLLTFIFRKKTELIIDK